jgi:hypothetical protein
MGMNGTDVYNNFTGGSSQSLQAAAQAVQQLSEEYLQEAQAIKDLQTRMNAAWTGSSGDAAYAGANPLAQAFKDSSGPLDITTASMNVQSDVFEQSKSRVVPVPPAPEKPSGWTVGLKAAIPIVGPSIAVSDIKSYQDGVAKTNAANDNNVRVMDQYSSVTGDARGKIPMDYKILPTDTASIGLKPPSIGTIGVISSTYNGATHASSTSTPSVGSPMGSGGSVSAPPTLSGASAVTSSGPTGGGTGSTVSPPPTLSGTPSGTGTGGTGSSAYVPGMTGGYNGSDTQRPGSSAGTTGTGGPTQGAGRNNSAASRLYGADEEGTSRRGGSNGSAAAEERLGRAAGESNKLGGGKSTGSGNLGSAAAAEEAAASRSAAKSAGGAPMGAGQRGRGEEDEEHQRPDYLLEADPDSIFGSDVRTTPPVIGE